MLIVAVQQTDYIKNTKSDTEIFYNTDIRVALISALRIVDKVVTYTNVSEIVKSVDFDVFAVGEDQNHSGFQAAIQWCENHNKQVVRLKRTQNISSTEIKKHVSL